MSQRMPKVPKDSTWEVRAVRDPDPMPCKIERVYTSELHGQRVTITRYAEGTARNPITWGTALLGGRGLNIGYGCRQSAILAPEGPSSREEIRLNQRSGA